MEKSFKRIKNYNVSVKEVDNKVIFLRKLERGGSEHSFGIHVAKMAGMPWIKCKCLQKDRSLYPWGEKKTGSADTDGDR